MKLRFVLYWVAAALAPTVALAADAPIDRPALVSRHNPVVTRVDYDSPLTVGNGGFAFTVDVTGLQSFPDQYHREGIPLETLARWAWVRDENPQRFKLADTFRYYTEADGRVQGYPTNASTPAGDWLRQNPRNHPLGQIALEWNKGDGKPFVPADVQNIEQTLDLWRGVIKSRYTLGGVPVEVTTACAPDSDTIAIQIVSELVSTGKLRVRLAFPRGHDLAVKNTPGFDWGHDDEHESKLDGKQVIDRTVPGLHYVVNCSRRVTTGSPHVFVIAGDRGKPTLDVTVNFALTKTAETANNVVAASTVHWDKFWRTSAVADFSASTNALAAKLEHRIVLSQYLTAVQMAGDSPPQESGLTCSTWYGKHHTEMIWWNTAHFALWGHPELLARNLGWYQSRLPEARALATARGLRGARWPKMVGPDARESPGGNPLIVWNQPHMVYLCEMLYRLSPTPATLAKYRELVLETADCLASMVWLDPHRDEYVLGPPLWIAQEIHDQAKSQNPSFEIAYWRWALGVAQQWRERLGLARETQWDDVIKRLAPLPQKDGKYVALESIPDTWDNLESRHDHPQMLMPLGFLPEAPGVDRATMERTLDAVLQEWDWKTKIWGWDYPMIAMTAARLGRPDVAVEVLLRDGPNNVYTPNGHCPQRSDTALAANASPAARRREIAVYLPANGSFLSTVALMLAGWDGNQQQFPGFPRDGTWSIRAEGWKALP
jgi:hypothetical protein